MPTLPRAPPPWCSPNCSSAVGWWCVHRAAISVWRFARVTERAGLLLGRLSRPGSSDASKRRPRLVRRRGQRRVWEGHPPPRARVGGYPQGIHRPARVWEGIHRASTAPRASGRASTARVWEGIHRASTAPRACGRAIHRASTAPCGRASTAPRASGRASTARASETAIVTHARAPLRVRPDRSKPKRNETHKCETPEESRTRQLCPVAPVPRNPMPCGPRTPYLGST
eukprot:scaffold18961_cov95-Isochrysis_galbana.AAC.1